MKLTSLRLSEFRRFAGALEIDGLEPGLNLFTGPNEAGKSTIAAALRAAFLERYNTTTVGDFQPRGVAGARPTVQLEFGWQGRSYRLTKAFMSRSRCELVIDGKDRLDGEAAQDALARLLGFEFAGKGQSKAEHGGVPGLLWVRQGDSQSLMPIQHAGLHIRDALNQVSGELAIGDGDRLLNRVLAERGELLDMRGKPRGPYRDAQQELERLRAERDRLAAARDALATTVDKLAGLKAAQARDDAEKPWEVFERKAEEARARQQAIRQERANLDVLLRERRQTDETLGLLQEQVQRDQREEDELQSVQAEQVRAEQAREAAAATMSGAEDGCEAARSAVLSARNRFELARAAAERRDVQAMAEQQAAELERLQHAAQQAEALEEGQRRLDRKIGLLNMRKDDLQALRQACRELDDLRVRRDAAATRLQYELPQDGVTLDGEALAGTGERLVASRTSLQLPNGGRIIIVPGGTDLAVLADRESEVAERHVRALAAIGVGSLDEAEARWLALEDARREADVLRRELDIHAPRGLETIRRLIDDGRRLMQRLDARLAELAAVQEAEDGQPQTTLQTELAAAEAALGMAQERLAAGRERLHAATSRSQELASREAVLAARLRDPAAVERREGLDRRLVETRSQRDDLGRRAAAIEARIAEHRPDLVEQDIQRLERSALIAREAYQARQREILLLQGRLDEAGEQGIGESLAQCEAQLERLARRHGALHRRAQALDLLHELLQSRRREATERLQAPLAQRLNHYLSLLFPHASLHLDEGFLPRDLLRGVDCEGLGGLSFGTQEQLGILARFAYADLLKQAGRPTLLILDDALVHTDDARREWMKRALFDAASRHQILMFTCHASAWKDLGVTQRSIASLEESSIAA